jgi:hypothetical protein
MIENSEGLPSPDEAPKKQPFFRRILNNTNPLPPQHEPIHSPLVDQILQRNEEYAKKSTDRVGESPNTSGEGWTGEVK